MEGPDIIIIGAGIIGLSIATALSRRNRNIIVIEKEKSFGRGASSRNSEIIHSGIYYKKDSLKARLCIEGRELLYQFCQQRNIPYKKTGKMIVATNDDEAKELELLLKAGDANGVKDACLIDRNDVKKREPDIEAFCAIYSPSTGIVDTHQLMKRLQNIAENRGVIFAYDCEVIGIDKRKESYSIKISDVDGEELVLSAKALINCAGLFSDKIARMAGIDIEKNGYKICYSKGEYFRVSNKKAASLNHLIYPTPENESLGIHTVMDVGGGLKIGPNAYYTDKIDYDVDPAKREIFYRFAKRFLPFLELNDLSPDIAGIRAKLQVEGESERDFVISDEADKGFPGFINLIGIESPGLTASLAIAKYVESMI
jgi:L-2-hydroxyglutarate oxidase LhgO